MKKQPKKRLYFSLDEKLLEKFENYCKVNLLDKSSVLEYLVSEYLKDKK